MKDRLEKFMKSEGLTPSRFAEIMGVQPSSISHILGGRNKPSYDFIEKILLRFPKINPDWLLLGKGQMYRVQESENYKPIPELTKTETLFDSNSFNIIKEPTTRQNSQPDISSVISEISSDQKSNDEIKKTSHSEIKSIQNLLPQSEMNNVERVVIFFKNRTFVSYEPK